jgi:hypothetical protein
MLRRNGLLFPRDRCETSEIQSHRRKPTERRYHADSGSARKSRERTWHVSEAELVHGAEPRLVFKVSSPLLNEAPQEIKGLLCSFLSFQNKQHSLAVQAKEPPAAVPLLAALQKKRKRILQQLRHELRSDRCFCIKEDTSLESDDQPALVPMPLLVEGHVQVFQLLNRSQPDPDLATQMIVNLFKSAEKTQALLFLLGEADSHVPRWLAECVWTSLSWIIGMKSSSAVLSRLASRSSAFHEQLSNYCILNLSRLVTEHNPGKLIQSLLQSDQQFRRVCLGFFKSHLEVCMKNFTALFLLTVAIKYSQCDAEYSFIKHKLVSDWKHYLQSKYFKRLIVSYIEYCSQAELVEMHKLLKLSSQFSAYLNDKFRAFILLMFLKREFEDVTEYFCHQIESNFRQLFKARYFKFLLLKCANISSTAVVSRIFNSLRQISQDKLQELSQKKNLVIFYAYILLRLCQPSDFPSAVVFLREHFVDSQTIAQLTHLADR